MTLTKTLRNISVLILALTVANACSFAPRYVPPAVDVPEHWRFAEDDSPTIAALQWWKHFGDPVLDTLVDEALEYNNDIRIAVCRVAEFSAQLGIVNSRMYPQIFAEAMASRQEASLSANPGLPSNQRVTNFFDLSLTMFYEVDLWGRIQNASAAAYADLLAKIQVQRTVRLSIVSSVVNAYIQLRQFDRNLQISRDTLTSREKSYEIARLRYVEGLTSELEAKQAESTVDSAMADIIVFERLAAEQENLISILVGRAPTAIERGLAIQEWQLTEDIPAGLPSELLLQRPDILQAEQQIIAANALIGVARAEYFPNISLTGLFGFQSLELHNLLSSRSRTQKYGVDILQPVFTGWRISSNVARAKAIKCEAYYNYERVVLNAFREVEDALVGHRQAKAQAKVQQKRVAVLQDYLNLATLQYNNGQTDYLNILDAERTLFAAQIDLVTAEAGIFTTLVNLYKALGGDWAMDGDCS